MILALAKTYAENSLSIVVTREMDIVAHTEFLGMTLDELENYSISTLASSIHVVAIASAEHHPPVAVTHPSVGQNGRIIH